MVIQLENLAGLDPECWPALVIHIVGVRDDGVQSVSAAAELENDQDGRIAAGPGSPGRLPPQARSGRAEREETGRLIYTYKLLNYLYIIINVVILDCTHCQ